MDGLNFKSRTEYLGSIFRLIEQFELISRTDLAKLSGLAPATITNLTKLLIDHRFVLERTTQASTSRGRPAVGLAVSPLYWKLLSVVISESQLTLSLSELDDTLLAEQHYFLDLNLPLAEWISNKILTFKQAHCEPDQPLLAVSISVRGKIDPSKTAIIQLGSTPLHCPIVETLAPQLECPLLLNEHFQLWLLTESTKGSLIRHHNAIFLELSEQIRLSVLVKGELLHKRAKMNVDKMLMPPFSELSEQIYPELPPIERYQLHNQISLSALLRLIDRHLPNSHTTSGAKIDFFCQQVQQQNANALRILNHLSQNLAYMLMNLTNLFSVEKIMLNSPFSAIKNVLFEQVSHHLQQHLLGEDRVVDLVESQYEKEDGLIPNMAIKQQIYAGTLFNGVNL
ncbi:transcriptional regulator [Haemophilus paracuniculus]|uniref:Transcriptional regulator n=1 Tax=Haemophilus paracuniculus TaxID=734 RepID=A0A1T0ASW5_9PAST|nr:ROK family protein [Haemophilus paracuniculus]OOR99315.1 transcriptional regulator [Haemophilus paracuniculus]